MRWFLLLLMLLGIVESLEAVQTRVRGSVNPERESACNAPTILREVFRKLFRGCLSRRGCSARTDNGERVLLMKHAFHIKRERRMMDFVE